MERDKTTKIIGGILAVLMFFALGFGLYYLSSHWDTIFGSTTEQPGENPGDTEDPEPEEPEDPVEEEKIELTGYTFAENRIGVCPSIYTAPSSYSREDKVIYSKDFEFSDIVGVTNPNTYIELYNLYKSNDLDGYELKNVPIRIREDGEEDRYFTSLHDFIYSGRIPSSFTLDLLESTFYVGDDYEVNEISVDYITSSESSAIALPVCVDSIDIGISIMGINVGLEEDFDVTGFAFSCEKIISVNFPQETIIFVPENVVVENQLANPNIAGQIYAAGSSLITLPEFVPTETDINDFVFSSEENFISGYIGTSDSVVIPTSYGWEYREDFEAPYPGNNEVSMAEIQNYVSERLATGKNGVFIKEDGSQIEVTSTFQVITLYSQLISCVARLEDGNFLVSGGENILYLSDFQTDVLVKSITISSDMEVSSFNIFENIQSLEELVIYGDVYWGDILLSLPATCKLYVKANLVDAYKQSSPNCADRIFAIEV